MRHHLLLHFLCVRSLGQAFVSLKIAWTTACIRCKKLLAPKERLRSPTLHLQRFFGRSLFCLLLGATFALGNALGSQEDADNKSLVVIRARLLEQLVRGRNTRFFLSHFLETTLSVL